MEAAPSICEASTASERSRARTTRRTPRRSRVMRALGLAPIRVAHRDAAIRWEGATEKTIIETGWLGVAGAAGGDRHPWRVSFRRLLDGPESPLQVVIEGHPGREADDRIEPPMPAAFADMRGADLRFAEHLRQSNSSHRFTTSLITAEKQSRRLESVLQEMGISFKSGSLSKQAAYGKELVGRYQHSGGFSRHWSIERLPGPDLEPGWLFRLLPPGLAITLTWHATQLPMAW